MYKVFIKLNRNHHVFPILKHYFKFIVKFLIKVPTELKFFFFKNCNFEPQGNQEFFPL